MAFQLLWKLKVALKGWTVALLWNYRRRLGDTEFTECTGCCCCCCGRVPTSATASDIKEAYYKQSLKLYVILCSTVHLIYTRQFYIKDWYVAFVLTRCVAAIQMKILIQRPRRTFKKLLLLLRYSSGIVILLPGFCICAPKCHHWRLMLGSLLQAQILNMVEFWCLARSWKMKRSGNNMTMRLLIPRRLATSFPQGHIQIDCVYVHASLVHLRYIWILKIL